MFPGLFTLQVLPGVPGLVGQPTFPTRGYKMRVSSSCTFSYKDSVSPCHILYEWFVWFSYPRLSLREVWLPRALSAEGPLTLQVWDGVHADWCRAGTEPENLEW